MAREIELFFDIGSSYSYLAATQMAGLTARTGVPVRWRPFLLGAVFKATTNDTPARVPAKARYLLADMARWSAHYGVPFKLPSRFPVLTLRAQRALTAAPEAAIPAMALSLFRAYWAEDQDPTTDAAITAAARVAGADAETILGAIEHQSTKDRLRATTDEAVARGAFGAPSMFVGEALFWGNDRIPLLEAHLAAP
ncbi:MAG: 2-hydroxychromene-2-carboxylate isomerase [Myxococcales bacterium]|nr:2-hydroxychromene-2-carboxylate isomerase [Myxococcales bacterium]